MSKILITSGPTRQYLDPVRYLTNDSSGRMGKTLACAAIEAGHEVTVVSGPVDLQYPKAAEVIPVVSTEEMLKACQEVFPHCDGFIGVAAPCDYRPVQIASEKIAKTGDPLQLQLVETSDIVASLSTMRTKQWMVAFALETTDQRIRAMQKLERKKCDLIILNGPDAIRSEETRVELLTPKGQSLAVLSGKKTDIAHNILRLIEEHLV